MPTFSSLIIPLLVIGFFWWLFNDFVPIDGLGKIAVNLTVAILVIVWLLSSFGFLESSFAMSRTPSI